MGLYLGFSCLSVFTYGIDLVSERLREREMGSSTVKPISDYGLSKDPGVKVINVDPNKYNPYY